MFKQEADFKTVLEIDYHEIQGKQIFLRESNSRQDMKKIKTGSEAPDSEKLAPVEGNHSVASMEKQFTLLEQMDYLRKLEMAGIDVRGYENRRQMPPMAQVPGPDGRAIPPVPFYFSEKYIKRQNPQMRPPPYHHQTPQGYPPRYPPYPYPYTHPNNAQPNLGPGNPHGYFYPPQNYPHYYYPPHQHPQMVYPSGPPLHQESPVPYPGFRSAKHIPFSAPWGQQRGEPIHDMPVMYQDPNKPPHLQGYSSGHEGNLSDGPQDHLYPDNNIYPDKNIPNGDFKPTIPVMSSENRIRRKFNFSKTRYGSHRHISNQQKTYQHHPSNQQFFDHENGIDEEELEKAQEL